MEIIGFTNWLDPQYRGIDNQAAEDVAYNLTVLYMREKGYRFTGTYHQNGEFGAPIFDTGEKLCLSLRGWGGLMAEVLNIDDDRGMAYCDWAWVTPDEESFPEN